MEFLKSVLEIIIGGFLLKLITDKLKTHGSTRSIEKQESEILTPTPNNKQLEEIVVVRTIVETKQDDINNYIPLFFIALLLHFFQSNPLIFRLCFIVLTCILITYLFLRLSRTVEYGVQDKKIQHLFLRVSIISLFTQVIAIFLAASISNEDNILLALIQVVGYFGFIAILVVILSSTIHMKALNEGENSFNGFESFVFNLTDYRFNLLTSSIGIAVSTVFVFLLTSGLFYHWLQ